ncbi:CurL C-terminal domain-containing protein, partial [Paenibacillus sp. OSY-SE]|uniref:CurL C-terminal domain-containing protein n=1 Tax=Paenibacillus sp. OSY-SE TaxID=1196323 RepID=UPI0005622AB7
SPFYVNRERKEWADQDGKRRLGGVSAFGMSGTNAHVVLQSYGSESSDKRRVALQGPMPYYLLAFSAKTPESLQKRIQDLTEMLDAKQEIGAEELFAISYTLLDGRQHFNHRCVVVIRDREDAIRVLKQAGGKERLPNLFQGLVAKNFNGQTAIQKYAEELLIQSRTLLSTPDKYQEILYALAELYCQGYEISWNGLFGDFGDTAPCRISLPTYPFARENYWVPTKQPFTQRGQRGVIHPLVHENTSGLSGQRFSSTFTGGEGFLSNEGIEGQKRLPEAAHLEMTRAAVALSLDGGGTGILLKDIIWNEPVIVSEKGKQVHLALYLGNHDEIDWEIYEGSEEKEGVIVNSEGKAKRQSIVQARPLDINALRSLCSHKINIHTEKDKEKINSPLPDFMEELWAAEAVPVKGAGQLLIKFKPSVAEREEQYKEAVVLEPALLEACLHAVNKYMGKQGSTGRLLGMKELEVVAEAGSMVWAFIRIEEEGTTNAGVWKLNIDLCDTN